MYCVWLCRHQPSFHYWLPRQIGSSMVLAVVITDEGEVPLFSHASCIEQPWEKNMSRLIPEHVDARLLRNHHYYTKCKCKHLFANGTTVTSLCGLQRSCLCRESPTTKAFAQKPLQCNSLGLGRIFLQQLQFLHVCLLIAPATWTLLGAHYFIQNPVQWNGWKMARWSPRHHKFFHTWQSL